MLTWETAHPPELKGPYKYDEKQGAVRILLDGQQRITTLYMLVRDRIPPYYTDADITNDTRGLFVNVETRELSYYLQSTMDNNPLWINITDIFLKNIRAKDIVRGLEATGIVVGRERDDHIDDKAVAAFANSQGGTLLIGVDDQGQVLGLGHDYLALGGVDRDKFELHLRNLFNQHLGIGWVTTNVRITFPALDGLEVCQVDVSPAKASVIVTMKDKNGVAVQKFYARSGNSSQEIPLSELHAFTKERFGQ